MFRGDVPKSQELAHAYSTRCDSRSLIPIETKVQLAKGAFLVYHSLAPSRVLFKNPKRQPCRDLRVLQNDASIARFAAVVAEALQDSFSQL